MTWHSGLSTVFGSGGRKRLLAAGAVALTEERTRHLILIDLLLLVTIRRIRINPRYRNMTREPSHPGWALEAGR